MDDAPSDAFERDIPLEGTISKEAADTPGHSEASDDVTAGEERKGKRPVSRRGRIVGRILNGNDLPSREEPTEAEKMKTERLNVLVDGTGGVKSAREVRTVVMVMNDERSPNVHGCLLEMIGRSSKSVMESLMMANCFLPVMHNWLNLYSKKGNDAWSDVLIKIVKVFGALPLTKDTIRELRIKIKRLSQNGSTQEVKREATALLDKWEEKRKDATGTDAPKTPGMSRMNSWPKRKVGKAFVAADPDVKRRNIKLSRKRSGPLSASEIVGRRPYSTKSSLPSSPTTDLQQCLIRQKLLDVDALPPEASQAINKLRIEKQLKQHKADAPSRLVHTMSCAPSSHLFYAQQKALYDDLRSEKQRQSLATTPQNSNRMQPERPWTEPQLVRVPLGNVIKAPMTSTEAAVQAAREKTVPAASSGLLYASILERALSDPVTGPVSSIPFFPRNEVQHEMQQQVLVEAGVALPVVLGPPIDKHVAHSPTGPLVNINSHPAEGTTRTKTSD